MLKHRVILQTPAGGAPRAPGRPPPPPPYARITTITTITQRWSGGETASSSDQMPVDVMCPTLARSWPREQALAPASEVAAGLPSSIAGSSRGPAGGFAGSPCIDGASAANAMAESWTDAQSSLSDLRTYVQQFCGHGSLRLGDAERLIKAGG